MGCFGFSLLNGLGVGLQRRFDCDQAEGERAKLHKAILQCNMAISVTCILAVREGVAARC